MSRDVIMALLDTPGGHAHLVGVCGVGMAGLAHMLKDLGQEVSGCDVSPNRLADGLRARGIAVLGGHDPAHLCAGVSWVIRSAAVPAESAEVRRARAELGLPVFTRGEVLPCLLEGGLSVAVGGTHGKTTTSWFITQVLRHAGRGVAWCIGGELAGSGGTGVAGVCEAPLSSPPPVRVVEADESDGTIALYRPDIAVVTNIDFDHMEHFKNVADFEACFRQLAQNTRRSVIYCRDDPRARAVCGPLEKAVSYGFAEGAAVRARDLDASAAASSFTAEIGGRLRGRVTLPVPGRHNVLNALAAAAVGLELGLEFEAIRSGLAGVRLPQRRFQKMIDTEALTVISDYAHHPAEIAALIAAARLLGRQRTLAVFQPHRYTRTLALGREFPPAFDGVDRLILVPVYAASESPLEGGTIVDLERHFKAYGRRRPSPPRVTLSPGLAAAWRHLRGELRDGDLLLVIGAGDVETIAHWAAGRRDPPAG